MTYSYTKKTVYSFEETLSAIKEALAAEGFSVLTEIDVQATMKQKLGVEYKPYRILGACNPTFAHQALQVEKEIGLLLPCNVIVYEKDAETYASAILPSTAMSVVENNELASIAQEVEKRLISAIDTL